MSNNENSLVKPGDSCIHSLNGKALRKWWQDPFVIKRDDVHANAGIQMLLHNLILIPIAAIIFYQTVMLPRILIQVVVGWLVGWCCSCYLSGFFVVTVTM
jgi:hypothetical protein